MAHTPGAYLPPETSIFRPQACNRERPVDLLTFDSLRCAQDEPWNWLQPGQSTVMQHHWKITMDYNYPEQAVWKLADGKLANSVGPCWDYVSQYQQGGQQGQQGYGQQGGMQQQGYAQQGGGYY
jgi:hypothetical protein